MLIFKRVILHNFGSYEHAELDLQERGFCLVTGQNNYKKDNALSNGSGKSFLWNALSFALTGETLQGIKANLKNISTEENSCYVELTFSYGRDEYCLTRYVAPKSDLKILKNGENVSGKGIRESDKKLSELLPDVTKDLVASTILIGQGMPHRFSSFSPSGRKELLEKLTKSDFMIEEIKRAVANRLEKLNIKLKEYVVDIRTKSAELRVVESNYLKHKNELDNMISPDYEEEITKLTAELVNIDKELTQVVAQRAELEAQRKVIYTQWEAITSEKATVRTDCDKKYYTRNNELRQKKVVLTTQISMLRKEIEKLKKITDICPTCGQKLHNVERPDTTKQEAELAELLNQLTEVQELITACDIKYKEYLTDIDTSFDGEIRQQKTLLSDCDMQLGFCNTQITTWSDAKSYKAGQLTKLQHDRDHMQSYFEKLDKTVKEELTEVNDLKTKIQASTAGQEQQQEHLAVVKQAESLLKREFRGFLLSSVIDLLNSKAKDYCEIVFETRDLEICLNGNALDITYCGKMFDSLSGGEKQRVDLILQFALRNILMQYLNFNSNIIVLDEITDFLDKKSCAAVMRLLEKELNTIESVFIISHHAETLDLPIDSEIHIIKNEQGISEVF